MWRNFYSRFAGRLSGPLALRQTAEQNRLERFFTFPNFKLSAERCGEELNRAGLVQVAVEGFPADGTTSWYGWSSMKAWDVRQAHLWLTAPRRELLCDWSVVPESLVMYSGPCEVEAELVEWNGEEGLDLAGKIPFTRHRINDVFPAMRSRGARGILSDFLGTLPGVRDPFDLPDDVRWENSALRPGAGEYWGFMITPRQGEMLRGLLRQGPVRVRAEIDSRTYSGEFHSATGVIAGSETPEKEILFVSHLYEPGANDNASGVGVGLELARSLNAAIAKGVVPRPRRSIRFLFNWEGYGLYAWLHRHADRTPDLLGGLNIDEIGVDQAQGNSVLHLFMPPAANPSCTGPLLAHLCGEILSPGIRWKAVADRAEIINDTISSDPGIDVPLPCLIQYPSRNYHSSADRLGTLSTEVMERIGLVSATQLYFLAASEAKAARWLAEVVAEDNRRQWHRARLRLASGSWPFDAARTREWFTEQAELSAASIERFGLPIAEVSSIQAELRQAVAGWCQQSHEAFPPAIARSGSVSAQQEASSLVPQRTTNGSPKAWSLTHESPEDERAYRELLYRNNLDLLFHRIFYWADGQRSLMDIIQRLEFEMDEIRGDTSISRTSSGLAIGDSATTGLDVEAVLALVDRIVANGYMKAGDH
jgi:aminopeptidase-like protein